MRTPQTTALPTTETYVLTVKEADLPGEETKQELTRQGLILLLQNMAHGLETRPHCEVTGTLIVDGLTVFSIEVER